MSELTKPTYDELEAWIIHQDGMLAALRAKVEAYKKGYEDQVALKDRHEAGYRETIAQLQGQLATLTAERDRLREALAKERLDMKRFEQAPCYLCGYNGELYYQPGRHACAARYHALRGEGG